MTRHRAGSAIAGVAAMAYLVSAGLHSTGYGMIVRMAEQAPPDLGTLAPAMWLAFSLDLTVVGLIVGAVAIRPSRWGRLILVIAALCPIGAAGLQLKFLGFIPPTALLLGTGGLALLAAGVLPGNDDQGSS